MAEGKTVYGHINCPHCGYASGMRITKDKTGAPFGFCEANCGGQLRIGGNDRRVAEFFKTYQHVKQAFDGVEVAKSTEPKNQPEKPVTVTEKKPGFSLEDL